MSAGAETHTDRPWPVGFGAGRVLLFEVETPLPEAADYCVAAGAWLRGLLRPRLALARCFSTSFGDRTGAPSRVVYGEDCYIIPRDNNIVAGA